jgi:hypothetical protein
MKRTLLLAVVILATLTSLSNARSYFPVRYRTRWSPYASGLVTGDVHYSPYAFGIGRSGLVPGNVRYSPYAFGVKRSGLVVDPWWPYGFSFTYGVHYETLRPSAAAACNAPRSCQTYIQESIDVLERMKNYNEQKHKARRDRIEKIKESKRQINVARQKDAKEIIRQYLKSKNINDFETNGLLKISNKTVNVNFILRDKNIMITYWDTDEVQFLSQQSGYKRNYYEKHEQTWRDFAQKYEQAGGKVYLINSPDEEEIIAKLILCSELNDG